jgi:hypothetical protein
VLEGIARRYPNSLAAERIRLQLLDDAGDVGRATRAARDAQESGVDPAAVLRRLAATAERAGAARRSEALLRRLAAVRGDEASPLPADGGKRYAELAPPLARTAPAEPPPDEAKLERWDAPWQNEHDTVRAALAVQGDDLAARGLLLLQRGKALELHEVAAASRVPLRAIWRFDASHCAPSPAPWHHRVAAVGERLLFAGEDRLVWLGLQSGETLQETPLPRGWRIGPRTSPPRPFCALEDGVLVLVAVAPPAEGDAQHLVAFDAETGALLWQRPAPFAAVAPPIAGGGIVALLGDPLGGSERGLGRAPLAILDAQTGWLRLRLDLPAEIEPARRQRAGLVVGRHLVLRHLRRDPGLLAVDLDTGRIAWADTNPPLADGNTSPHKSWFLIAAAERLYAGVPYFDPQLERERLTFLSIDAQSGARRQLAVLGPFDVAQGLQSESVVELPRSELVLFLHEGGSDAAPPRCTLLDLATGAQRFAARQAAGIANARLDRGLATRPPFACIDDRSFLLHLATRQPNGRSETLLRRFSARHGEPWSAPFPLPSDEITTLTAVGGCYVAVGPHFLTVLRAAESSR